MTTESYHYPYEQDNDSEWGFFIYLETDVFLTNTIFDDCESTYYENLIIDDCESTYYENLNTDSCELFNVIKQNIEYFTVQIYISGFIIYTFFNSGNTLNSHL
jgi:hypothetical protein